MPYKRGGLYSGVQFSCILLSQFLHLKSGLIRVWSLVGGDL